MIGTKTEDQVVSNLINDKSRNVFFRPVGTTFTVYYFFMERNLVYVEILLGFLT